MQAEKAVSVILWIALIGVLFSGYLSYTELTGGVCGLILGLPSCVYGFVMYLIVFLICIIAVLKARKKKKKGRR